MNFKHRPSGIVMIVAAIMLLASCGKKEKKVPLSRQDNAVRSINAALKAWQQSKAKRSDRYIYAVDATNFASGVDSAVIATAVQDDVVQCRILVIDGVRQWVEKGNDINGREGFPEATTIEEGLRTCEIYARDQFTDNYEFDYSLSSSGDLTKYGCYYKAAIATRPPRMVVAPRELSNLDFGICNF